MFLEGTEQIDSVGGVDPEQLERKCGEYGKPRKGEPVLHDVNCTLEELYVGKIGNFNLLISMKPYSVQFKVRVRFRFRVIVSVEVRVRVRSGLNNPCPSFGLGFLNRF